MKKVILVSLILAFQLGFTEEQMAIGIPDRPQEYTSKGGLFSVKLIPGAKETRLVVVGKDVAKLDINKLDVTGTLKLGKNEKVIKFRRQKDYFSTNENLNKGDLNLRLMNRQNNKSDEVHFNQQLENTNP
jgi:hypothetical protein